MRLYFVFLILLVSSCSPNDSKPNTPVETEGIPTVRVAEHFSIEESAKNWTANILDPETGTIEHSFSFTKGEKYKLISLTSTVNGMVSILDATDCLAGIGKFDYVHDSKIKELINTNMLTEFGDENSYSLEKIIASGANIVLYSGFGNEFPNEKKLNALGIQVIPVYDWREKHPLGKAEWIKFIGAILNRVEAAKSYFDEISASYNELASLEKLSVSPTVLAGNVYGDIWYAPNGDSFMAQLIEDAGGDYMYKNDHGTGSLEFSMERIIKDHPSTEIWINPGLKTKKEILDVNPHAKHLKAFENVYGYAPNMNLFWERSASEPHILLKDLISIFHPETLKNHELKFYQEIN